MRRRRYAAVAIMVLLTIASVHAQNPITGGARAEERGAERSDARAGEQTVQRRVDGASGLGSALSGWSRELQASIASLSRRVMGGEWAAAIPAVLLSIVFGAVHIAGPGHGKVFAVSYFSGRPARIRDGLAFSGIVNVIDSLSAFAFVMAGYVILRAVLPEFRQQGTRILELVSYGLIVGFGIVHLVSHLRGGHRHAGSAHDGAHDHGHTGGARHEEPGTPVESGRSPWLLAVSVGLVPCPVSTVLFVYGVANGALPLMAVMVAGVSLGGFITMALLASAVIAGRSGLLRLVEGSASVRLSTVLEYAASGLIIVVGALLFIAAF